MLSSALRRVPRALPWLLAVLGGCTSASSLPKGCESSLIAAPSVSTFRIADRTPARLFVAVTTTFPEHRPLGGVRVDLFSDTLDARATNPLRSGTSDTNGHLELDAVPQGRYGLRAQGGGDGVFFSAVDLRGAVSDSLEIRLVTRAQVCY